MSDASSCRLPDAVLACRDVCGGAKAGWSIRNILVAFVALVPLYAFDLVSGSFSTWWHVALGAVLLLVAAALLVLACAMIAAVAGWEYGRDCYWTLGDALRMARARGPALLLAYVALPLGVGLCGAVVTAGCLALGRIPAVGEWLAGGWLVLAGLPLGFIGVVLAFLGAPAMLLMPAAGALDCREAFEIVSRCVSYVRNRPLDFALSVGVGVISSAVSALVFGAVLLLFAGFLLAAWQLGVRLDTDVVTAVQDAVRDSDALWPLRWGGGEVSLPAAFAARLLTASFLASVSGCLARTYLALRWALDREPPSALVHVDESFEWGDGGPHKSLPR